MAKLIQKDITFDFDFHWKIWAINKAIKDLREKYNVEQITKSWSYKRPLSVAVTARVNIKHEVDIDKIREAQYKLNDGGINV